MGFHEVTFDSNMSYGSSGGPGFRNLVFETDSGHDQVVERSAVARHTYDVSKSLKDLTDLAELKEFYLARHGMANGWRYKDWWDYHSNPDDPTYKGQPGESDQDCSPRLGTGALLQFQLMKTYTSSPTSYYRLIKKPVEDTVRVWLDGVEQVAGWSVDSTTGVVTFSVAPGNGVVVTASFEFHVPVRFAQSADRLLSATIDDFGSGTIGSIIVTEILDPGSSTYGEFSYGGSRERIIYSGITVSLGLGRFWNIVADTAGFPVNLPDPADLPAGGPLFYIANAGANSFPVKDEGGVTLVTLATGQCVEAFISRNSSGDPMWEVA